MCAKGNDILGDKDEGKDWETSHKPLDREGGSEGYGPGIRNERAYDSQSNSLHCDDEKRKATK